VSGGGGCCGVEVGWRARVEWRRLRRGALFFARTNTTCTVLRSL